MSSYMITGVKLPPDLPCPRFLLEADLTQFTKPLYAVLLDRAGRIERRRQSFSQPNRIYVKISDGQTIILPAGKKLVP